MKTIKFLKNNQVELNGILYQGYTICDLPSNFGCITWQGDKEGVGEWFNYKGLTYIIK